MGYARATKTRRLTRTREADEDAEADVAAEAEGVEISEADAERPDETDGEGPPAR